MEKKQYDICIEVFNNLLKIIAMSTKRAGPNVNAIAKVRVVDVGGSPVGGATVFGQWSGLTSDSDAGVTDGDGSVSFNSDKVRNASSGEVFTFTTESITKDGGSYDPSTPLRNIPSESQP